MNTWRFFDESDSGWSSVWLKYQADLYLHKKKQVNGVGRKINKRTIMSHVLFVKIDGSHVVRQPSKSQSHSRFFSKNQKHEPEDETRKSEEEEER